MGCDCGGKLSLRKPHFYEVYSSAFSSHRLVRVQFFSLSLSLSAVLVDLASFSQSIYLTTLMNETSKFNLKHRFYNLWCSFCLFAQCVMTKHHSGTATITG